VEVLLEPLALPPPELLLLEPPLVLQKLHLRLELLPRVS
jgi:hypothetical protein